MMEYDFGPQHPLKPERLWRTMALLQAVAPDLEFRDPDLAEEQEVLRVHDKAYMEVVKKDARVEDPLMWGFGRGDNPPFSGMHRASLAYLGGTVQAAKDVRDGAGLAFNLAGGLHHARRDRASGFCIYNDVAIACTILRDRFSKVIYIDIDVHHGDGVQWIFYDDPSVVTFSIHEEGRTLYPGTGFVEEQGAGLSSINVPLPARTTGDAWFGAFAEILPRVVDFHRPEAIVLQMGCDAHHLDPLGHLSVSAQEWVQAVDLVRQCQLPTVAVGGGGYNLTTVPRMWAAATLALLGREIPAQVPESIPQSWGMTTFLDHGVRTQTSTDAIKEVCAYWKERLN